MEDQKEEVLTPYTLADRNEILVKYANFSFKEALAEVKDELQIEKDTKIITTRTSNRKGFPQTTWPFSSSKLDFTEETVRRIT